MIHMQAISTTGVVTTVIEPRRADTASESVGCSSSPIVYTIENPTDTMQVEECGSLPMAIQDCHQAMTKQRRE